MFSVFFFFTIFIFIFLLFLISCELILITLITLVILTCDVVLVVVLVIFNFVFYLCQHNKPILIMFGCEDSIFLHISFFCLLFLIVLNQSLFSCAWVSLDS